MKRLIFLIIIIILMAFILGLYVFEIVAKDIKPTENLLRTLCILLAGISSIVKLYNPKNRSSLQFYKLRYDDVLGNAFAEQPRYLKQLLKAIRVYNRNEFMRAVEQLKRLKKHCQKPKDHYSVDLFIALCYTDARLFDQAETVYKNMINNNYADSLVYSNLGHLKLSKGKFHDAIGYFEYALSLDPSNAQAYNNLATVYFDIDDLDSAIEYAKKALERNGKMKEASSLLTIIYSIKGDTEKRDKYFHIAVSSGYNPDQLNRTIEYFLNSRESNDEFIS